MTQAEYKKESEKIGKIADDIIEAIMISGGSIRAYKNYLVDKGYSEEDIMAGTIGKGELK